MPVHWLTTSAISSESTSFLRSRCAAPLAAGRRPGPRPRRSASPGPCARRRGRPAPGTASPRAARRAAACGGSRPRPGCTRSSPRRAARGPSGCRPGPDFSISHWPRRSWSSFSICWISCWTSASRSRACSSSSLRSIRSASWSWSSRRWRTSISVGTDWSSIDSRLAASSTRSIALSGRKRSVMYRDAQLGGGHQGRVLDLDLVVDLVALLQAAEDRDRVVDSTARRRRPAGSDAPGPGPSRCARGTRRGSWRRCSGARPAPGPA